MDMFIKKNKDATWDDFSSMRMFYSPFRVCHQFCRLWHVINNLISNLNASKVNAVLESEIKFVILIGKIMAEY